MNLKEFFEAGYELHVGDVLNFKYDSVERWYILCSPGHGIINFISLSSGTRWGQSIMHDQLGYDEVHIRPLLGFLAHEMHMVEVVRASELP